MYQCLDCGEIFDDCGTLKEDYYLEMSEHTEKWVEETPCCPFCQSVGIIEVKECQKCGKFFPVEDLDTDYEMCEDCMEEMADENSLTV